MSLYYSILNRSAQTPARRCTHVNDVRCRDSCRFQNLHNSLPPLSALVDILSVRCQGVRGVPLGMRRIPPEYLDPETSDRSVAADVLVREEPTKKKMKRETAKKKRAKKKTTRVTQSDHRMSPMVRLSFLLREHRHNKSRQAQTLKRGASRSPTDVRHNDQFNDRDIADFNSIFLDLAYCVKWAEIPLLAHNFSK